jgi:hypothetical protein
MAERGHIREVLDEAGEEKGQYRTASEQSPQRVDDEAGNMHDNRRAAHL